MTIKAFQDSGDGYYEVDIPDGQPAPAWVTAKGLTPTPVIPLKFQIQCGQQPLWTQQY